MVAVSVKAKEAQSRRQKRWRLANPKRAILHCVKSRAKAKGIICTITADDIPNIPDVCPILGIPIIFKQRDKGGWYDDSPSVDRIKPELGYIPGNIRIISNRANRIRFDATLEELEKILVDARSIGH